MCIANSIVAPIVIYHFGHASSLIEQARHTTRHLCSTFTGLLFLLRITWHGLRDVELRHDVLLVRLRILLPQS